MKNTRNLELRHRRHTSFKTRLIRIFINFPNLLDIDRLHMMFLERYASELLKVKMRPSFSLWSWDENGRQDQLKLKWMWSVTAASVCMTRLLLTVITVTAPSCVTRDTVSHSDQRHTCCCSVTSPSRFVTQFTVAGYTLQQRCHS